MQYFSVTGLVLLVKFFPRHKNPGKPNPTKASFIFLGMILVDSQHLEPWQLNHTVLFGFGDVYFITLIDLWSKQNTVATMALQNFHYFHAQCPSRTMPWSTILVRGSFARAWPNQLSLPPTSSVLTPDQLAPDVQTLDSTTQWINPFPLVKCCIYLCISRPFTAWKLVKKSFSTYTRNWDKKSSGQFFFCVTISERKF